MKGLKHGKLEGNIKSQIGHRRIPSCPTTQMKTKANLNVQMTNESLVKIETPIINKTNKDLSDCSAKLQFD
jgi:hypothetical protein